MENSNQLHAQTTTPPGKGSWYSLRQEFGGASVSLNAVVKRNTSAPVTNPVPFLHFFSPQCSTLQKKVDTQKQEKKLSLIFL